MKYIIAALFNFLIGLVLLFFSYRVYVLYWNNVLAIYGVCMALFNFWCGYKILKLRKGDE